MANQLGVSKMLLIFLVHKTCILTCMLINLSMRMCKNEESAVRMFETLLTAPTDDSNKPFGWHTPADFWRESCHRVLRSQEWWKDGGIRTS